MNKQYIITKIVEAKEMYSKEAKDNNYIIKEFSDKVPGYEIKIDENFTTWCTVEEFTNIAVLNDTNFSYIPECPNWADENFKNLYKEFNETKEKIEKIKNYIINNIKDINNLLYIDTLKLQYKFMLGYINCINVLIRHYYANNDIPKFEDINI